MEKASNQHPQTMIIIPEHEYLYQRQLIEGIKEKIDKLDFEQIFTTKEFISVKEVLQSYCMCRSQFEALKHDGIITTYKIKGKVYVKRAEIKEVFEKSKQ